MSSIKFYGLRSVNEHLLYVECLAYRLKNDLRNRGYEINDSNPECATSNSQSVKSNFT